MSITDLIPIPSGINPGVTNAKQSTMLSLLGNPRSSYTDECQDVTDPALRDAIAYEDVGPFRTRGHKLAVAALRSILVDVAAAAPEVYHALGTAGMLCARLVRGSTSSISNHSWGTAIDLTLDGILDRRGDRLVQQGLASIAPVFNQHGWFWGAGFDTEDAMHFEVGDELLRRWWTEGSIGKPGSRPEPQLTLGDRGPEVVALQQRLRDYGADIVVDGDFGVATRAAVIVFQSAHQLAADGVVGPETRAALGL